MGQFTRFEGQGRSALTLEGTVPKIEASSKFLILFMDDFS